MAFHVLFATTVLCLTALFISGDYCYCCLFSAYQKCANDPTCAKQSVISYMHRFAQDCNNDGVIDCYDFAAIHKLGGFGCKGNLPHDFKTRFLSCQNTVKNLSG
ncbi:PREDICTED: uncharacterized protein LOC107167012 [Diuraphis noxia]|uniref:uncharacterized protein LOC107167012 n=1 Tax=Diuraphis noxia TaxID=143948 RepID=UPI00076361CB|nr:PREDICTED: uncharacterized protein LOC107167012 [Diuraphis noxia]